MSIVKRKISNLTIEQKHYLIIALVCLLSQGLLLIVSGRWWDDWVGYDITLEQVWQSASMMGRPSGYIYEAMIRFLPQPTYRFITFILNLFCALFFYQILDKGFEFNKKDCLYVSLIYLTIPAFDCRIMRCIYDYTLGLFFLFAAFRLLVAVMNNKGTGVKYWIYRVCNLLLFVMSFTLNSTLVFYAVPFLFIIYREKKIWSFIKYPDYILLPFAFFFCKNYFFPVWGIYADYNQVSTGNAKSAFKNVWFADESLMTNVIENYKMFFIVAFAVAVIVAVVTYFVQKSNKKHSKYAVDTKMSGDEENKTKTIRYVAMLIAGAAMMTIGLFPYVVIRETQIMPAIGVNGRDSVLGLIGVSLILYALMRILLKSKLTRYVVLILVLSGTLYFNSVYLDYQKDYYMNIALEEVLKDKPEVDNYKNIILVSIDKAKLIDTTRYYTFTGVFYQAYGTKDKFICENFSQYHSLLEDEDLFKMLMKSGKYHMEDFDFEDQKVDAGIIYTCKISKLDFFKLKWLEIFDQNSFREYLKSKSKINVFERDSKEYKILVRDLGGQYYVKKYGY